MMTTDGAHMPTAHNTNLPSTRVPAYQALPALVREYVELYLPCETDPLALGLAALAAVSAAIGRGAWADYCGQTHPGLWVAVLGMTGLGRKEQAARCAEKLLLALQARVAVLHDVSSGEALLEELEETPQAVLLLRELSLLTDRARTRETRLLATKLLELYDMPETIELRRVARGDDDDGRVVASKPTLGLVATGTPSDLTPLWDLARRGLVNRLLIVPVREQPLVPRPAAPNDEQVASVAARIRARLDQAHQKGRYALSDEAGRRWDEDFYPALREGLRNFTELERSCIERRERQVVVLATLSTILEGRSQIGVEDLTRGIALVCEANERLIGLLGSTTAEEPPAAGARRAVSARGYVAIMDVLRQASRPISQKNLAGELNIPRISLQRRLDDLLEAGLVYRTKDGYSAKGTLPHGGRPARGQVGTGHPGKPQPSCPITELSPPASKPEEAAP
jgi:hypothetical protein